MHMTAPVSDGTLNVVCVSSRNQQIPASAPGNAAMMMNGSSHDWKLIDDQQIDQQNRADQSDAQPDEGGPHGSDLSAHNDVSPARQIGLRSVLRILSVSAATAPRSRSCVLAYTSITGCTL